MTSPSFPAWRSILFVPGDRPGAVCEGPWRRVPDAVCIDLEDAVAPTRKAGARISVARFLAETSPATRPRAGDASASRPHIIVRVNDPDSEEGRRDAAALAGGPRPDAFMIPKVTTADGMHRAGRLLGEDVPLIPIIETALGLENAAQIVRVPSPGRVPSTGCPRHRRPDLRRLRPLRGTGCRAGVGAPPVRALAGRARRGPQRTRCHRHAFTRPHRTGRAAGRSHEGSPPGLCRKGGDPSGADPGDSRGLHPVGTKRCSGLARSSMRTEPRAEAPWALEGRMVDRPVVEAARRVLLRARSGSVHPGRTRPPGVRRMIS